MTNDPFRSKMGPRLSPLHALRGSVAAEDVARESAARPSPTSPRPGRKAWMIDGPTWFAIASSERARIVDWSAGVFRTCCDLRDPGLPPMGRLHFAAYVAGELNRAAAGGQYRNLVLVAPARMLCAIREGLDPGTRRRIAGQAAKDVAAIPDDELPLHLPRWLRLL